jgi:hypothetical protein
MSGLSLMPAFGGGRSNHSQSPVDEVIANMQDARHRSRNNSLDGGSSTGSPTNGLSGSRGIARPPGLGGPGPSPIGKPGHSKNSSASTAQSLTLTPSSSIDGTFDMYRQSSPFHGDGPSMPPLRQNEYKINASIDDSAELPRGMTTFGSFDASDRDNDGLLGLDALRDRAHSANFLSSSPPVPMRGQIAPHGSFQDEMGARGLNPEQRRPRAVSRDSGRPSHSSRPPLSGGSGLSPHTDGNSYYGDRNLGSVSIPFSGSRSRDPSPPPNYTQDGNDLRGPGVISRPGLLYGDAPERIQRTISNETGREYMHQNSYNMYQNGNNAGDKFGSLASLGTQMPNQRMYQQGYQQESPGQMHEMQRHQRSLSQPGPMRSVVPDQYSMYEEAQHRRSSDYGAGFASNRLPPSMDNDYNVHSDMRYNQQTSQPGIYDRSVSGDGHYPPHGRSMSMTHQAIPSQPVNLESQGQRRSSLQMTSTTSGHLHAQAIRRRESLDFVPGHSSRYNDSGVPIVASGDEMRMFGNADGERTGGSSFPRHDRLVSPAHSPLHVNYGGHSRQHSGQHSDMGSSAMSSSPMSLGSSGMVRL